MAFQFLANVAIRVEAVRNKLSLQKVCCDLMDVLYRFYCTKTWILSDVTPSNQLKHFKASLAGLGIHWLFFTALGCGWRFCV